MCFCVFSQILLYQHFNGTAEVCVAVCDWTYTEFGTTLWICLHIIEAARSGALKMDLVSRYPKMSPIFSGIYFKVKFNIVANTN